MSEDILASIPVSIMVLQNVVILRYSLRHGKSATHLKAILMRTCAPMEDSKFSRVSESPIKTTNLCNKTH